MSMAPLIALGWSSLRIQHQWDLRYYRALWADPQFALALTNSLKFTGIAGLGAGVIGIAITVSMRGRAAQMVGYLSYIVSGVLLGTAYIIAYPGWIAHFSLLMGAYILLAYPFVARTLFLALQHWLPHWGDAARTLGATASRVQRRLLWPWITPALQSGIAFATASALGEFAMQLLFSRPEWITLPQLIFARLSQPRRA